MQNKKIIGLPKKIFFAIVGGIVIIAAILVAVFVVKGKTLSPEAARTLTENYVNTNLMPSGSKVKISDVKEFKGSLYQMKIDLGNGQSVESYVTRDGSKFFPQAMDLKPVAKDDSATAAASQNNGADKAASGTVSKKTSKPAIELFVMSYCPYGTQIEKGIIPAIQALGDKVDFKLKFVSYSMHGQKELAENLNQYCIQKQSPAKLLPYLSCFLQSGDSASCLKQENLNVSTCVAAADKEFKVTEDYNNKVGWQGSFPPFNSDKADNDKYNVQGSPTLIINGGEVSSSRDPQSLLNTICSGFDNAPDACNTKLSTTAPAAGFGSGSASSGGAAQCGS